MYKAHLVHNHFYQLEQQETKILRMLTLSVAFPSLTYTSYKRGEIPDFFFEFLTHLEGVELECKEEKKKKKKEEKRREQSRHFWMETIVLLQSKINSTSQNIQVLQDQIASETNEINAIKDSINTLLLDQEKEKQLNGKYFLINLVTYIIINYQLTFIQYR